MKSSFGAAAVAVLLVASSLTAEGINAEVVRLNTMAGERIKVHDWDSAERDYVQALDIAARSEAKPTLATLHQNLASVYTAENRYADAERQDRLAYELLKSAYGEYDARVVRELYMIGEATCLEGHFKDAKALFQRSFDILNGQKSSNKADVARALTNLAAAEWFLGDLPESEKSLSQLTALVETEGRQQELAFALQLRARIAEDLGNFRAAEAFLRRALVIVEQSGNTQGLVAVLVTSAQLFMRLGDLQEAQARLERARKLIRTDPAREGPLDAALMCTLAVSYQKEGKSRDAEVMFERAIRMDQRVLGPDHPNLLCAMRDYAQFLRSIRRNKDAKRLEHYIRDHSSESERKKPSLNVVDFRQLLQQQKH